MGSYTRVGGEIRIDPPLTWDEIKASPFYAPSWPLQTRNVVLRVDEESTETAEGTLTRRTSSALVPPYEDAYKAYDLPEHVQEAIRVHSGHTFTGRLECSGEEPGDLWRVVVRDGRAERVEPRIVWPDEDEPAETDGLTVYRAEHYSRGIVLCTYTTPDPAREHCETELRREHVNGDRLSLDWVPDDEDDPAVWELYAQLGDDEFVTGYCVAVVDVHDTYRPESEES